LCDVIAHKDEYGDVIGGWAISSLLKNSQRCLDWMIQQYFPLQILIIPVSSYFTALTMRCFRWVAELANEE